MVPNADDARLGELEYQIGSLQYRLAQLEEAIYREEDAPATGSEGES
jgi:hypothetical protein